MQELTQIEINIFKYFYENQGKDIEMHEILNIFDCTESMILNCLDRWTAMVQDLNIKHKKVNSQKYHQLPLF